MTKSLSSSNVLRMNLMTLGAQLDYEVVHAYCFEAIVHQILIESLLNFCLILQQFSLDYFEVTMYQIMIELLLFKDYSHTISFLDNSFYSFHISRRKLLDSKTTRWRTKYLFSVYSTRHIKLVEILHS